MSRFCEVATEGHATGGTWRAPQLRQSCGPLPRLGATVRSASGPSPRARGPAKSKLDLDVEVSDRQVLTECLAPRPHSIHSPELEHVVPHHLGSRARGR